MEAHHQPPNQFLPPIRGVKASDLGSHFSHLCDLRLKFTFSLPSEVAAFFGLPDGGRAPAATEVSRLVLERGEDFENSLVTSLRGCASGPGSTVAFLSYARQGLMGDLVDQLRRQVVDHCRGKPGNLFVIHEPKLSPEDLFFLEPSAEAFKNMFPDFLFLFWSEERGKMVCVVVDAKSSRVERLSHRAQVGVYQRMLRALVKSADLAHSYEVPDVGGVWVPETDHTWLFPMPTGFPHPGPSLFNCDLVQTGLGDFLRRIGSTVNLRAEPPLWSDMLRAASRRVNGRCSGCEHLDRCSTMAGAGCASRVTSLPYIKDAEAAALDGIAGPEARVSDVENLLLQRDHPAAPVLRALVPPALVEALRTGQPAARAGYYSASFPKRGVHWGLAVSAYQNPLSTKPEAAAWGVQLVTLAGDGARAGAGAGARYRDGELACAWLTSPRGGAEGPGPGGFASARELTRALVEALWVRFAWLTESFSDKSVFLFASKTERVLVDSILLELALFEDKDVELAERARDLFLSMTEGTSSIELGGADVLCRETDASSSGGSRGSLDHQKKISEERASRLRGMVGCPRVVVLDDIAREMLHLPSMRGLYTTAGVLTALTGELAPPCFEATMEAWCVGSPLGPMFAGLFACVKAAVHRIHDLVPGHALLFDAGALQRVAPIRYSNHALGRLSFVAQWESFTSWRRIFVPRATLPLEEQLQAGIAIKLVVANPWSTKGEDGFKHSGAWFRLHPDSRGTRLEAQSQDSPCYNNYILTRGEEEPWNLNTRRYVDIAEAQMSPRGVMAICGCAMVGADDPTLVRIAITGDLLKHVPVPKVGEVLWMFPRFVDWTRDLALSSLRAWDDRPPSAGWSPLCFSDLVSDQAREHLSRPDNAHVRYPASGAWPFKEGSAALDALLDTGRELGLAESQLECLRRLALTRFLCLWGPAGSGKTHTLSRILLALAAHTRDFKVCAVSSTHNAVDTLLDTLVKMDASRVGAEVPPSVIVGKLVNPRLGDDFSLGTMPEFAVKDVALDEVGRFWRHGGGRLSVVGGTVWKGAKYLSKASGRPGLFDLVIVDEASQMPLNNASIAHELVHPANGRLVIAGDHKQLPPVMVGDYPPPKPGCIDFSGSYLETVVNLLTPTAPAAGGSMADATKVVFAERSAAPPPDSLLCVAKLRENFRMNRAHAELCASLTYGADYRARPENEGAVIARPSEDAIADVVPSHLRETVRAALDPDPKAAITGLVLKVPRHHVARVAAMSPAEAAALEAHVAVQIAKAFLHDNPHLEGKEEVLIITPHHVQRKAVNALLEDEEPKLPVVVNVVEKMQGKTATLVIACLCSFQGLTDGAAGGGEGPRGGRSHFFLERQRLNVTLTRAKCKTILLTTESVLHFGLDSLRDQNTEDGIRFFLSAWRSIPNLTADTPVPRRAKGGEKREREVIEIDDD